MFLIGLYLASDVVASYGLMMQFVTIVTSISVTFLEHYSRKLYHTEYKEIELRQSGVSHTLSLYIICYVFVVWL